MTGIALDKASVRSIDANGHLHIAISNISKATVNPYYGHEIPDFERLGLDAGTVYYLLRDPEELKKALPTFNNMKILSEHVPVSAGDPAKEITIGSTGTDAVFNDPYLQNSTVIWTQDDIDDIQSETKREWSCAYRYRADMTPGAFKGLRYDGVMRDIRGNHLALVEEGRAGPDVVVGDQSMKRSVLLATASRAAAQVKLAMDAGLDVSDVVQLIAAVQGTATGDPAPAEDEDLNDASREGDDDDADKDVAEDEDEDEDKKKPPVAEDEDGDDDKDDKPMSKPAMDARIARVRKDTLREMNAIRAAERAVAPFIGEIAMDSNPSAAAIYCMALDNAKVAYPKGQSADVYAAMVAMLPAPPEGAPVVAMDRAGAHKSFGERFPNASTLIRS